MIHLDLALAYERMDRKTEADAELATARRLAEAAAAAHPSHPRARFQLAVVYLVLGEQAQAASLAGKWTRVADRITQLRGR